MVRPAPDRRLWLVRSDSGWAETEEQIPWTITRTRITGQIQSSLYDALDTIVPDSVLPVRERVALAWAIADVYDWEVDFTRDVRDGDRFEVLFERLQSPEGERRFGRILAARVDAAKTVTYAFYSVTDTGRGEGGFYDEQGRSLRRAFLRAPLRYRHISSRFGSRYHPILHIWRNHAGVDFSAAYGTPVRATADGVVTRVEYEGAATATTSSCATSTVSARVTGTSPGSPPDSTWVSASHRRRRSATSARPGPRPGLTSTTNSS